MVGELKLASISNPLPSLLFHPCHQNFSFRLLVQKDNILFHVLLWYYFCESDVDMTDEKRTRWACPPCLHISHASLGVSLAFIHNLLLVHLFLSSPFIHTGELSHLSVLRIQQLVSTNPLVELHFGNIHMQDQQHWVMIVESLDPARLETFGLYGKSHSQFLSTSDAVDLYNAKLSGASMSSKDLVDA